KRMDTKTRLAELLTECEGGYLSGSLIAEKLGVTRAAVWKHIRALEGEGYKIEGVTNKGYRLSEESDVVSCVSLRKAMGQAASAFHTDVYESVTSTNTILRDQAEMLPHWSVAVAGKQTAGKGRVGRSFFSPEGTGIYLSVLMKEGISGIRPGDLTTAAAVAACRAIYTCTGEQAGIKWVNDVYLHGKKVCGILTEAVVSFESGTVDKAVTGIGFNVYEPEGGFPEEIADTAGAITKVRQRDLRARIAAEFIIEFRSLREAEDRAAQLEEYRERCFIPGRKIYIIEGGARREAEAVSISDDFGLLVRNPDGGEEVLTAGEVSIRI
ncbi:MAG: biotin--[acetyl-CoA-carboxylase] ligase, partial [Lachnospiraceae bacterium]|nr:biotin--[acetyl-CoA-carboxylase] ligase [Lachnospiraceae bacterium]